MNRLLAVSDSKEPVHHNRGKISGTDGSFML